MARASWAPQGHFPRERRLEFLGEMLLIRRFAQRIADESVAFDESGTDPGPSDALEYVYASESSMPVPYPRGHED